MKRPKWNVWHKRAGLFCTAGVVFQVGSCNFSEITTTTTLDGREVIITLVRNAILTPIDLWITAAVNEMFDAND